MLLSDVVESEDRYTAAALPLGRRAGPRRRPTSWACASEERQRARVRRPAARRRQDRDPQGDPQQAGKLTDEEFEVMKTHTIEGQFLLDRVGGLLGRVGEIVRSCHERWDGRGYPDGLAGEEIPLAARIVFSCDAYNAMTTDRVYRKALSQRGGAARAARQRGHPVRPAASSPPSSECQRGSGRAGRCADRGRDPRAPARQQPPSPAPRRRRLLARAASARRGRRSRRRAAARRPRPRRPAAARRRDHQRAGPTSSSSPPAARKAMRERPGREGVPDAEHAAQTSRARVLDQQPLVAPASGRCRGPRPRT